MTYFILLLINLIICSKSQIFNGKCGYPGKPYNAKLEPDNKLQYLEGEEVTIQCTDYWSFIQTRRCEKGRWTGKPPRCGDFVKDVVMKEVKVEDITEPDKPIFKFEHLNMSITNTQWKYPNSFTSNRFKKDRLRITDDKKYKWSFKFNASAIKLFVRINFNFINYTLLTPEQKQNFTFSISVNVSSKRQCVLNHQSDDLWRENGRKIDNDFTCDSLSLEAYEKDIENPGDYMFMETQASIGLHHELIAVIFGKPYGTPKEPLCGEPEVSLSHLSRFNQIHREYYLDCKDKVFVHSNVFQLEKAIRGLVCKGDMIWDGVYPECVPIKPCPLNNLLIGHNSNQTVVNSVDGLYFFNDSYFFAYEGSEVNYGCLNPSVDVLLGKENRICQKNGTWSSTEPYCYDPNDKFRLILIIGILFGTLFLVIVLTAILFLIYTKRNKRRVKREMTNKKNSEIDEYDDITYHSSGKELYDTYDVIRDGDEEEVRYADPYYTEEQDYVQMPSNVSNKSSAAEPAYLEMTDAPEPKPRNLKINEQKYKL